jgi:hypothetical protein
MGIAQSFPDLATYLNLAFRADCEALDELHGLVLVAAEALQQFISKGIFSRHCARNLSEVSRDAVCAEFLRASRTLDAALNDFNSRSQTILDPRSPLSITPLTEALRLAIDPLCSLPPRIPEGELVDRALSESHVSSSAIHSFGKLLAITMQAKQDLELDPSLAKPERSLPGDAEIMDAIDSLIVALNSLYSRPALNDADDKIAEHEMITLKQMAELLQLAPKTLHNLKVPAALPPPNIHWGLAIL